MRRWIAGPILLTLVCTQITSAYDREHGDPLKVNSIITWIEWWETNRDTYIRKVIQKQRLDSLTAPKAVTANVIPALLDATHDASRDVRAEAALALARMGEGKDRLLELTRDPDQRVRCRAWVGLGLLQQENELLNCGKLDEAESLAVITGFGLLDKPGNKALQQVRIAAQSATSGEVQRMAIWALRVYHGQNSVVDKQNIDNSILLDVLTHSPKPAVVTEALVAMGTIGGWQDLPQLADVAQLGKQTLALPAFAAVMAKEQNMVHGEMSIGQWEICCMRGAACLALAQMDSGTKTAGRGLPDVNGGVDAKMTTAEGVLQMNALKDRQEVVARGTNIILSITNSYFPGMSVLALPRFGESSSLTTILAFGDPTLFIQSVADKDGKPVQRVHGQPSNRAADLPQRGYAAMAMGISGDDDYSEQLRLRAMNPHEPRHLRAACVLAMGLTGEKGNADWLVQIANGLNPNSDSLIYGHIVLALGLLQDQRALEYAGKFGLRGATTIDVNHILNSKFDFGIQFITPGEVDHIDEMDAVLGTRAALLGLAVLGDSRAGPALLANWGQDQWISLESARAMGWCGVYDGVDPLLALMKQTKQKNIQAWAARCLGEMLDREQPSKLSRLIEGNFYPYPVQWSQQWLDLNPKSERIEHEYQGLANPLLYWQILPRSTGDGAETTWQW